jgi:hypothetical protein
MLKVVEESSARERGEVGVYEPAAVLPSNTENKLNPPPNFPVKEAEKVTSPRLDSFDGQFFGEQDYNHPDSRAPSRDMTAYAEEEDWGDDTSSNGDEADTGAPGARTGEDSWPDEDGDDHTVNKSSDAGLFILPPPPDREDQR